MGTVPDEVYSLWEEQVLCFVDRGTLRDACRRVLPWEERFRDPLHLDAAFRAVGLQSVAVHQREYRVRRTIGQFLETAEISAAGRFLRRTLAASQWERLRASAVAELQARCHDPYEQVYRAYVALGTKHREKRAVPLVEIERGEWET
jgi:hypothetical protein